MDLSATISVQFLEVVDQALVHPLNLIDIFLNLPFELYNFLVDLCDLFIVTSFVHGPSFLFLDIANA